MSIWIDCWNQQGGAGLRDEEGRGRKTILTEKEQRQAINIVEQEPRSTKQNLLRIEKKTGKKISPDTLRRVLKKGNKVWKLMSDN